MKVKKLLTAICAAGVLSPLGSAQASIIIDDWTLNLNAAIAGMGKMENVSQASFNALYHSVTGTFTPPTGGVGDLGIQDVLGAINSVQDTGGLFILKTDTLQTLNGNFELTFQARTDSRVTFVSGAPIVQSFTHDGGTTAGTNCYDNGTAVGLFAATSGCILEIYLDSSGVGGAPSVFAAPVPGGGTGMIEGILIASFELLAGNGGTFSNDPSKLDGADDSRWALTFNLFDGTDCVLEDNAGACMVLGSTMAFVNSTTDADQDNDGSINTVIAGGPFGSGLCGATTGAPSALDSCGVEEGKFQLIPEPGTVALLGIALAGFGALRRRRAGTGKSATA